MAYYSILYLVTNEYQTTTVTFPRGFILFMLKSQPCFFFVNTERKAIQNNNNNNNLSIKKAIVYEQNCGSTKYNVSHLILN